MLLFNWHLFLCYNMYTHRYPGSHHRIELVEADLLNEDSWVAAVKDCMFVLHVASPFPVQAPKDENDVCTNTLYETRSKLKY